MQRDLSFGNEGRKKLKTGIDKMADAITVTFGGAGRNVLIEKMTGYPQSTKDGVTVAKSIELPDRIENMGAMRVREAAEKTVDVAGDGTTVASLLTQKIIGYGMQYIEKGANPVDVKRGIEKAVAIVVQAIKKLSKPADTPETLKQIATISANNDVEIGKVVAEAIDKVGRDGVVEVEEGKGYETTIEMLEGMQFDRGYLSSYFANNEKNMKCELDNPLILLFDKKISILKEFIPLLTEISKTGRPLLIISEDLSDDILKTMITNKIQHNFKVCAVKLPTFGGSKDLVMEDLAILTHGRYITEKKALGLKNATISMLGSAEKVVVTKDKTTIIGGAGGKQLVEERCAAIREEIKNAEFEPDKIKLKERLSKLSHGVAVLKVGGATEGEISEKRDRIDDALCATRAAVDEGFIAGGGVTFLKCSQELEKYSGENSGEGYGIESVKKALIEPFKKILSNAGYADKKVLWIFPSKVDKMIKWLRKEDYGCGINVKNKNQCWMFGVGIIDPAKVARVAFENAASVAGLFLTTECIISNISQ